jgi:hypothetical protein
MSQRILAVSAKCSDCCSVVFPNGKSIDGYVPRGICIGGGDYADFMIDIDTGKIVGWDDRVKEAVLKMQEEAK